MLLFKSSTFIFIADYFLTTFGYLQLQTTALRVLLMIFPKKFRKNNFYFYVPAKNYILD